MRKFLPTLILIATLCAFYNSPSGAFVFDDRLHIVANPGIRESPWYLTSWLHTSRPLVQFTLALNYAISGLAPWSYHVFNVLVHAAAALTLFGIARFALRRVTSLSSNADPLAAGIALLWAVHPLQTESVTYVIQRAESLMGFFCFLVIYCALKSTQSSSPTRWLSCGVLAFAAGLATKPVMVVAPLLMLIFDRTFLAGSFRRALSERRGYYLALICSLFLLPLFLNGRAEEWKTSAGFSTNNLTPLHYASTQPRVIARYLQLAFWPDGLCLDYNWPTAQQSNLALVYTAILILLAAASLFLFWRKPMIGFPGAWFFLSLAPTSSFIPIADVIFEHRMYLPLAAVTALTVIGIFRLVETMPVLPPVRRAPVFAIVIGLIATALIGRTILRNDDYASPVALWSGAIEVSPHSARAHYNLGVTFAEKQRFKLASRCFAEAIRIRPNYVDALYNLGNAFLALHLANDAIPHFQKAATLSPNDAQIHNNLGVAFLETNSPLEAALEFNRALAIEPSNASAHFNRAKVAKAAGEYALAAHEFRAAITFRPGWIAAQRELATVTQ